MIKIIVAWGNGSPKRPQLHNHHQTLIRTTSNIESLGSTVVSHRGGRPWRGKIFNIYFFHQLSLLIAFRCLLMKGLSCDINI